MAFLSPSRLMIRDAQEINIHRGRLFLDLARSLGVTCEYLLDESLAYPYVPPARMPVKGSGTTRMIVTLEEKAFILALRRGRRELAARVPYMTQGEMCVVHRVLGAQVAGREREVVEGVSVLGAREPRAV